MESKEVKSQDESRAGSVDEGQAGGEIERVAREMGIAMPAGASGLAHWLGSGMRLRRAVMDFSWALHADLGYEEVKSPCLAPRALFEQSGHAEKYGQMMFSAWAASEVGAPSDLMLRPMSCPNHISIFLARRRFSSEMPWKVFEFGEVFRNEPSGSLSFLLRARQFCQDDAHAVAPLSRSGEIARGWLSMALKACSWMGCGAPELRLAARPASRLGSDAEWDMAESALEKEMSASGMPWSWAPGDGAFYGPKIELGLRDDRGRLWQMGVFQLDLNLPGRFGLKVDGLAEEGDPLALVHHAVFGSIERAVGVMLACRGKDLPARAHPNALAIIAVSEKSMESARAARDLAARQIQGRAWLCDYEGPLGVKIARAKEAGWLRVAVVGPAESKLGPGWVAEGGRARQIVEICAELV